MFQVRGKLFGKGKRMNELDRAILTEDLPDLDLHAGDIGTIVLVHGDDGYEVEFVSLDGETLAVISLRPNQLRPAQPREIAHARMIGAD